MKETASIDYRSRIYAAYVTARDQALAPGDIAGLRPRLPHFRCMIRRDFASVRTATILKLACWNGVLRSPPHLWEPGANPFLRSQGWGRG